MKQTPQISERIPFLFFFFSVCAIQLAIPIRSQIRRSHDFSLFPRVWPHKRGTQTDGRPHAISLPHFGTRKTRENSIRSEQKKSSRNNGSELGNEFKFRLPKRKLWLYYLWACALCTDTTLDFTARLFISKEKNEKSLISKRETVWGGIRPTSTHAPDGVEKRRGNEVALSGNLGHEARGSIIWSSIPLPRFPRKTTWKSFNFSFKKLFLCR